MKITSGIDNNLDKVPASIKRSEALGFDEAFTFELNNDPFFPLLLAAEHSKSIGLSTSISVAFARNPMTLANQGWDLNQYSKGRFTLGIGSQIEAHITRRFSMPWSKPAARMREFILAMQAIWRCWATGGKERLDFRGEFYQHTLMTPNFVPAQREFGAPKVRLAGVGPLMTEVAGEVADGLIVHGFSTPEYIREVMLPSVERGLSKAGKGRDEFEIVSPIMVVSGSDEASFIKSRQATKAQLAFYGSTPAYKSVLDLHGWGDLQPELNRMSKAGKWAEMGALISDDILNTFAIVTEDETAIAPMINKRYNGLIDNWQCTYATQDDQVLTKLVQEVQTG